MAALHEREDPLELLVGEGVQRGLPLRIGQVHHRLG